MPIKPYNIIGVAHCLLKDIYIKIKASQKFHLACLITL